MATLDSIDRMLLAELQSEGRVTNVDLAKRVGLTAPPCLRRVRALEEEGVIKGYHAELDADLRSRVKGSEMITELFVPRAALPAFMEAVRADARQHGVDIVYGTIRVIEPDDDTVLAWARQRWACSSVAFGCARRMPVSTLCTTVNPCRRRCSPGGRSSQAA